MLIGRDEIAHPEFMDLQIGTNLTLIGYCFLLAVHIVGRCGSVVFDDRVVRFELGEGSEVGVVEGVEIALKRFSRGEKSRLEVKSSMAYGAEGCPSLSIPSNSDLVYEVELRSCERVSIETMSEQN